MTDLQQAAQQALEALEHCCFSDGLVTDRDVAADAILAIKQALAQPEQEPVKLHEAVISAWSLREVYFDEDGEPSMHRSPPAAPEQEPVAYYHPHKGFYWAKPTHISAPAVVDVPPVPLYVKWIAAQRTWVGLTDEERFEIAAAQHGWEDLLIAAEAKLKERNT
jgi:hypothetical protein